MERKENVFGLIGDDSENQQATKLIKKSCNEFIKSIHNIKQQFPEVGIGDTATDEAIVDYIYHKLH